MERELYMFVFAVDEKVAKVVRFVFTPRTLPDSKTSAVVYRVVGMII